MSSNGHMGLLQKANLLSQKKGLAFGDFIQNHNIKTCAVFTKNENQFFINQSIGFDGISICFSASTVDFWKGLIPDSDKIYRFSTAQKTLSSVLQFFSIKLKDEIDFVDIYRTVDNKILLLCNKELTEEITKSFSELDVSLDYKKALTYYTDQMNDMTSNMLVNKYTLDFEAAIDAFITQNVKSNQEIAKTALANEIQNRLLKSFSKPHFYAKSALYSSKVVLTSTSIIPQELVKSHLVTILKPVLEKSASLIEISNEGICQSFSQITDFLQ